MRMVFTEIVNPKVQNFVKRAIYSPGRMRVPVAWRFANLCPVKEARYRFLTVNFGKPIVE